MATVVEVIPPVVEESKKSSVPDFEEDSGVDNTSESGVSCDDDLKTDFSSTESVNVDLTKPKATLSSKIENDEDAIIVENLAEISVLEEILEKPENSPDITKEEYSYTAELSEEEEEEVEINLDKLPEYFKQILQGRQDSFDPYVPYDNKPSWYDEEKFKRGQKFALEHMFGVSYAESLSLFMIFSLKSALDPLIYTDRSHTPYKAFERYLSTITRVISWYEEDPWKEGSRSQRNLTTVRNMHRNIQTKLTNSSPAELSSQITLDGRCPMWSTIRNTVLDDFRSACPVPPPNSYKFGREMGIWVSQYDMAITQLAFVGMAVTYPDKFGIHNASTEDLEGFIHVWRTLGYLLGIKDMYNYCNTDLEGVRERTQVFINFAIKPSFRDVTPEWEHMCRCLVRGVAFYVRGFSFEVSLAYLCSILKIHTPRLTQSLSMWDSIKLKATDFTFNVLTKIPGMVSIYNSLMMSGIRNAQEASPETLQKWEQIEFPYMKQNETVIETVVSN